MPKKSCVLHIGAPKTGTSSLQFSLRDYDDGHTAYAQISQINRDPNHSAPLLLASSLQAEIDFDCARYETDSNGLSEYKQEFEVLPISVRTYASTGRIPSSSVNSDAIKNFLSTTSCERIIFSGEGISQQPGKARQIYDYLSLYFDEIRVYCYIRPYSEGLPSRIQQRLKADSSLGFFYHPLPVDMSAPKISDRMIVEQWDGLVGRENVFILPFKKDKLHGGDIVFDFSNRLGLNRKLFQMIKVNESLSAQAIGVLAAFSLYGRSSRHAPIFPKFKRALNILLADFGEGRLQISSQLRNKIREVNRQDLEWMQDRTGVDLCPPPEEGEYTFSSLEDIAGASRNVISEFSDHMFENWGIRPNCNKNDLISLGRALVQICKTGFCDVKPVLPTYFNPERYLNLNEDLMLAGVDPIKHFLTHGFHEGRFI